MIKKIKLFGYNFIISKRESVNNRFNKHYKLRRQNHICILCSKKAQIKKDGSYYRHCEYHRKYTNISRLNSPSYIKKYNQ